MVKGRGITNGEAVWSRAVLRGLSYAYVGFGNRVKFVL